MPAKTKINLKRALKMRMQGATYEVIAKDQGITRPTVYAALKPLLGNIPGAEQVEVYQKNQADVMDALAAGIVASITNEDLAKASLQQKATSIAIFTDKARLIKGQHTSASAHVHLIQSFQPVMRVDNIIDVDEDV
jgi:hypothetical protein